MVYLPPPILLDSLLKQWLIEDLGRGDRTTAGLFKQEVPIVKAQWVAKQSGLIAGLPIAERIFKMLNAKVDFIALVSEGAPCQAQQVIAEINGPADALLSGERVALNLSMSLSGIATLTRLYVQAITDLPTLLVDTRKTTPGLRILEKYATQVGGAVNHRMGLDDGVMVKDNHIQVAGGIGEAITCLRNNIPYPLSIEVETSNLTEVAEALKYGADIIMLDNMEPEQMSEAVKLIRSNNQKIKIEASGNITLNNIRVVAQTGVDYISTSAPITRSSWLDLSMRFLP